jgi:hypothetical protein
MSKPIVGIQGQYGFEGIRGFPGPVRNPNYVQIFQSTDSVSSPYSGDTSQIPRKFNTFFPNLSGSNSTTISGLTIEHTSPSNYGPNIKLPSGTYFIEAAAGIQFTPSINDANNYNHYLRFGNVDGTNKIDGLAVGNSKSGEGTSFLQGFVVTTMDTSFTLSHQMGSVFPTNTQITPPFDQANYVMNTSSPPNVSLIIMKIK